MQVRQAFLCGSRAFLGMFAGILFSGINACESGKRFAAGKAYDITNLSYKRWTRCGTDTIHCHDNRILRQGGSKPVHFQTKGFRGFGRGVQHCHSLPYQRLCVVILWEYGNQV